MYLKSLGIGKNTSTSVIETNEGHFRVIICNLFVYFDSVVPKMSYVLPTNSCNKSIIAQ